MLWSMCIILLHRPKVEKPLLSLWHLGYFADGLTGFVTLFLTILTSLLLYICVLISVQNPLFSYWTPYLLFISKSPLLCPLRISQKYLDLLYIITLSVFSFLCWGWIKEVWKVTFFMWNHMCDLCYITWEKKICLLSYWPRYCNQQLIIYTISCLKITTLYLFSQMQNTSRLPSSNLCQQECLKIMLLYLFIFLS